MTAASTARAPTGAPARTARTRIWRNVMTERLKKGDKVEWSTPQGKTSGKVVEKVTGEKRVANKGQKGTKVKGSEEDPRYVVESDRSGKKAAHKADALKKK
jgi:NAD(P)H-dependent flavin oxidoreductase YrpB (nitropropane dioxygenase family)